MVYISFKITVPIIVLGKPGRSYVPSKKRHLCTTIATFLTEVMSNLATSALLIPLLNKLVFFNFVFSQNSNFNLGTANLRTSVVSDNACNNCLLNVVSATSGDSTECDCIWHRTSENYRFGKFFPIFLEQ